MQSLCDRFRTHAIILLLLLLVLVKAFLIDQVHVRPLNDYDEARYAEVAKNVLKTGDVLVPMAGGPDEPQHIVTARLANDVPLNPFFWKPPLVVWLQALCMRLIGASELAARLPSLFASIGILVVLYKLMHEYKIKEIIAVALTATYAVSYDFSYLAIQGTTDALLCFLGTLTAFCAHKDQRYQRRYTYIAAAATGFAVLTKSVAAFWIPLLYFAIILLRKTATARLFIIYITTAIVIGAPWFIFMYIQFGDIFITRHFLFNLKGGAEQGHNFAPPQWYLTYMMDMWKPVIFFTPLIIFTVIQTFRKKDLRMLPLLVWVLLIIVPFSIVGSKVWWYVYPLWPPFILLTAFSIDHIKTSVRHVVTATVFALSSGIPYWTTTITHIPLKPFLAVTATMTAVFFANERYGPKLKKNQNRRFSIFTPLLPAATLALGIYFSYINFPKNPAWNTNVRALGARHQNLVDFGVLGRAYEAPLFYFDTAQVATYNHTKTYLLVKHAGVEFNTKGYKVIDKEGDLVLYKRINP